MRVLVDATMLDGQPSGASTRLQALGAAHARRGAMEVVHLVRPDVDALEGLAVRPFAGATTPVRRALAGRRLDAAMRECDAALLHAGALPLPRVTGGPVVLTLHDLRFLDERASPLRRLWASRRLVGNLARAARIVTVSRSTADGLIARGLAGADRIVVVPNAPTPSLGGPIDALDMGAFRRRADLNRRYVLALGPVRPHKAPGHLLAALAAAHAQGADDLGLVFAGRADAQRTLPLLRRAASMGLADHVRVVGLLTEAELDVVLAGADALAVAGRDEGFSIPVVDAQARGIPVVAVDAGALPEVVGPGGRLVAPGDAWAFGAALAAAVLRGDARDELIVAGRTAAARWSWDRSAETLEQVWAAAAG